MNTDECQSRPRRIAFFSDSAYPTINGVSVSIASLMDEFHRRGILVDLYSPSDFPCLKIKGVSIPLAMPWSRSAARRFRENLPDVVHIHTPFGAGIAGLTWAKKHGIPVVYSHHTHYPHFVDYVTPGFRALASFVCRTWLNIFLKRSKAVITPTAASEKWLQDFGFKDRINVVPTGTNWTKIAHSPEANNFRTVLCVGRLAQEKNLDIVIHAFSQLDQSKYQLTFVGDGPLRSELTLLCEGLNVQFLGELNHSEMEEIYANADALAFAADRDTQGLVVNEALAAGLPIAVVQGGGADCFIQPGITGYAAKRDDFFAALSGAVMLPKHNGDSSKSIQDCVSRILDMYFHTGTLQEFESKTSNVASPALFR